MEGLVETLELGLRVLSAVNEHHQPAEPDVRQLRELAPAGWHDRPIDELACEVIQQAMKRRFR
jgi:hypothetical protein